MDIKADEISKIIQRRIEGLDTGADIHEVGTVISVGDGIARVHGLDRVMAGDLASFLSIPLSMDDRRRLASEPGGAEQALDYYVTGRRFLAEVDALRGPDSAAENFRQAIRLDPDFTLAHVGLSEALWETYLRDLDRRALEEAERHAGEALRLDPELAEVLALVERHGRDLLPVFGC